MVDIRQTANYADYLKREGWIVERVDSVNYFIKKLPLIGYILKTQRPEKLDFGVIDKLSRKYRIFQTVVEPKETVHCSQLTDHGFKLSKSPFLPTKTLQIDLSQKPGEILKHFKKDARAAIKRGGANIVKEYSSPDELKTWRSAWKKSVNFKRFVPGEAQLNNIRKSFPQYHSIFLASHNIVGRIIGGVLFTTSSHDVSNYITFGGDAAYYWYGFTNKEGRTSLSQYTLLYQGILWAKKHGYKIFDLEGIYDERFPNKSWLGFTHFKRSFGGVEVLYPGAYTKLNIPRWK